MKSLLFFLITFLFSFFLVWGRPQGDILPPNLLAFPFGNSDYLNKITSSTKNIKIWSEKKIMSWAQEQGFSMNPDSPDGGYQYRRGLVIQSPGMDFTLSTPTTPKAESQYYGWKLIIDLAAPYSPSYEARLSSNYKNYENILRYEIYIDNILFRKIEIGYGVTVQTPIVIDIPYIHDPSGKVKISIKLKNHPANFAIIYDAFLTLD